MTGVSIPTWTLGPLAVLQHPKSASRWVIRSGLLFGFPHGRVCPVLTLTLAWRRVWPSAETVPEVWLREYLSDPQRREIEAPADRLDAWRDCAAWRTYVEAFLAAPARNEEALARAPWLVYDEGVRERFGGDQPDGPERAAAILARLVRRGPPFRDPEPALEAELFASRDEVASQILAGLRRRSPVRVLTQEWKRHLHRAERSGPLRVAIPFAPWVEGPTLDGWTNEEEWRWALQAPVVRTMVRARADRNAERLLAFGKEMGPRVASRENWERWLSLLDGVSGRRLHWFSAQARG